MRKHLLPTLILFIITTSVCQAQNPTLWGMTSFGGTNSNGGNIFKTTITGTVTDIHNFGNGTDGNYPLGSPVQASNGLLYGMTENGGTIGTDGMIYSYDISTNTYTDIHDFGSGDDGYWPLGSIIQANNGLLYGMTQVGGANGAGMIFSYDISTSTYTDIHDFNSASPQGSLMQASSGLLYGMTQFGGTDGDGVIFSYDISNSTYTELYDFKGGANDGQYPQYGSLLQVGDSMLYGMTSNGGANAGYHGGVMFRFNIFTNKDTVLHTFGYGTDGNYPEGSLIQASNGLLYGMATYGGTSNYYGTIFSYDISNGTYFTVHNFGSGTDGGSPYGSLLQVGDSLLYGMTRNGGTNGEGTIFTYNILADTEIDIHDFSGPDGEYPEGNLIVANLLTVTPSAPALCSGDSVTLIAGGATTYTWVPSTGLSSTTGDTVIASPTITTTYILTGMTAGSPDTTSIVVTVNPSVTIMVNSPSPFCYGDSTTLTVNGAKTYTWTPSTGLNATTGGSVIANPSLTTTYTVIGTNSSGCSASKTVTVTVDSNLVITALADPSSYCTGGSSTITASGGTAYTWSPSTDLSATTGAIVTANPTATTVYTVTGMGSGGCSGSVQVTVTVISSPNTPTFHQHGDTLISSSKHDNQWYRYDTLLKNDTSQDLIITALGEYWVNVTNEVNGCSTASDSMNITQITGIEQLTVNSGQVTVYPNPTNGTIFITINSSVADIKDWNLQIINVLGQTVYSKSALNPLMGTFNIDLSDLPNGVYLISVINKTGRTVVPVVKQN